MQHGRIVRSISARREARRWCHYCYPTLAVVTLVSTYSTPPDPPLVRVSLALRCWALCATDIAARTGRYLLLTKAFLICLIRVAASP